MLSKPMVVVVNSKHPWAKRKSVSMQALSKVKFATYHFDTPIGNETRQLLEEHGIKKPSLLFDDEFMLSSVVAANKEIVGLMLDTFEIDPFKDKVTVLPIDEVDASWHKICLAYDSRIYQSKHVQQFIEVARDCAPRGGVLVLSKALSDLGSGEAILALLQIFKMHSVKKDPSNTLGSFL